MRRLISAKRHCTHCINKARNNNFQNQQPELEIHHKASAVQIMFSAAGRPTEIDEVFLARHWNWMHGHICRSAVLCNFSIWASLLSEQSREHSAEPFQLDKNPVHFVHKVTCLEICSRIQIVCLWLKSLFLALHMFTVWFISAQFLLLLLAVKILL